MGRKLHPHAIEPGRARKRINVPLAPGDAVTVDHISARRGFPNSRVVAYIIGLGVQVELDGRIHLDRPAWPKPPTSPKYTQAAFSSLAMNELIVVAESAFEPLNVTASAMFQFGLAKYLAEESAKANADA